MPRELSTLLTRAMRRWLLARFVFMLVVCLTAVGALALLVRGGERVFPFVLDWAWVGLAGLGLSIVVAAAVAWLGRPDRARLAMLIDERAELRETISTAVLLAARPDPWSRATVEHANASARRVVLRDALPITVPRWWAMPPVLVALVAGLGLTPRIDLIEMLASNDSKATPDAGEAAVLEARMDVQRTTEELRKAMSSVEAPELQQALDELLAPREALTDPADIRREALRQLTDMQDRLDQLAHDDMGRSLDELSLRMRQIEDNALPDLKSLLDAMRNGNFHQALRELRQLADRASDPDTPAEERERLAEQLRNLGEQLKRQSERLQQELDEKLREAGVDPGLASSPQALREALREAGMNEQEIERLMRELQQNQRLQEQLQQVAGNFQQCAGEMDQGAGGAGQGMQAIERQLQEMRATQEQREAAMRALRELGEARAQLGQRMGGDDDALRLMPEKFARPGGGGAGSSWMRNDDGSEVDESEYQIADRLRAPSPQGDGPIMSTELVFGDQLIGESRQAFADAVARASQAATETVTNTRVPREYHDVIRRYFGELEKAAAEQNAPPAP